MEHSDREDNEDEDDTSIIFKDELILLANITKMEEVSMLVVKK